VLCILRTAHNRLHQIDKINISDARSYVVVEYPVAKQALKILTKGKIKGHKFKEPLINYGSPVNSGYLRTVEY